MIKKFVTLITVSFLVLYLVWPSMNPFDSRMFEFHDETQVGRIESMVISLKALKLPPRLAPEYSFNLGFPVFNFYAPAAYWITGIIAVMGVSSILAVKLSFMIAVVCAFLALYYLCSRFFDHYSSLLGASVYVTSTYFATEIVVRGNLAESWFLVFLPLSLGLFVENSRSKRALTYITTTLSVSFLFTSHNMLSLLAVPITVIFLMFFKEKKKNLLAVINAILIASYFLIPAFLESHFVQAASVAKESFNYVDHFLCPWQLWTAHGWQFGGSFSGCDADMMSFKIGKIQMILGGLGVLLLSVNIWRNKQKIKPKLLAFLFLAILSLGSLFLTLFHSKFIWNFFKPVMALFQFPWRFLVFGMFGVGFFSAYFIYTFKHPFRYMMIFGLIIVLFITGRKYFIKPMMEHDLYNGRYNSLDYRQKILAYNMREYLAKGVDFDYWHYLNPLEVNSVPIGFDYQAPAQSDTEFTVIKNESFEKEMNSMADGTLLINIHDFPFWQIYVNNQRVTDYDIDHLARPKIKVHTGDTVLVKYVQTPVEKFGNIVTLIGVGLLFVYKKVLKRLI